MNLCTYCRFYGVVIAWSEEHALQHPIDVPEGNTPVRMVGHFQPQAWYGDYPIDVDGAETSDLSFPFIDEEDDYRSLLLDDIEKRGFAIDFEDRFIQFFGEDAQAHARQHPFTITLRFEEED